MTRTFVTGTAVDSGGSAPANMATIHATIKSAILANSAWEVAEDINGSAVVINVLRNKSSSSGLPKNTYLIVSRTIATGAIAFFFGEDYSTGTHILSNGVPVASGSARAVDPATGLLTTSPSPVISPTTGIISSIATSRFMSLSAVAIASYAIFTDIDHCVIRVGTQAFYFGAVDSFLLIDDPMPVGMITISGAASSASNNSGFTRTPGIAAGGVANSHGVDDLGMIACALFFAALSPVGFATPDPFLGGVGVTCEVAARAAGGAAGMARGRVKLVRMFNGIPAGTAIGDTCIIGGHVWQVVHATPSLALVVDTGV